MGSILCLIGLEETFSCENVIRIGCAAEPDVCGRIASLFLNLCLNLTC